MKTLLFVIVILCGVKSEFVDDYGVDILSNTEAESDQYNLVDPLDSEFYGMTDDDQDLEVEDTLSDIEDDVEDVIEKVEDEIEVMDEDDDNDEADNGRHRKRGHWRRNHRQTMRRVHKFMNNRNTDDIADVTAKKIEGPLRRVHEHFQSNAENGKPLRRHRGYRKIKRKVNKKWNRHNRRNLAKICQKVRTVDQPKAAILSRLPQHVRPQYIEIFQRRREILTECCGIEDHREKKECFLAAALEKFEGICQVEEHKRRHLVIRNWNKKSECCGIEDIEEKQECYLKVGHDIKKGKWNKDGKPNARKRMARTCRNVKKPTPGTWRKKLFSRMSAAETQEWRAIFISRRQSMRGCCEKPWSERFECAAEIRQERLNRVCTGEENLKPEPLYNEDKHGALVQECCQETGEDRVSCFTSKKKNRGNATLEIDEEVEIVEDGDDAVEVEIRENSESVNSRITRNAVRRRNKLGREVRRRNRLSEARQEKKAAKRNCCEAGAVLRTELLNVAENVTESDCLEELTRIENVVGLRSSRCEKVFMKCCTSSVGERRGMKQMRKEMRKEKRKERKANRQSRRQQEVETDEV